MGGGLQDPNVARRIANADKELKAYLKREFTDAARKVADEAKQKILAASTRHPGGLRAEIAGTVEARARAVQAGVQAQIRSNGRLMPPGKETLNAYANAGTRRWARWRHPVYGPTAKNPDPAWVQQEWPSAEGWLDQTVRDHARDFSGAVQQAIDDAQRYLEGRL